jgi:hypothetical protein
VLVVVVVAVVVWSVAVVNEVVFGILVASCVVL